MAKDSEQTFCTNPEWVGRAHCSKCHIRRLMFFSELPDVAFDKLLQPIDQYIYPPGSVLYETGSQKKFIYSIRQGMVKLVHEAEDGSSRIVRLLGPGAAIGLELLEGAKGYHHTAKAITQVDQAANPGLPRTLRYRRSAAAGATGPRRSMDRCPWHRLGKTARCPAAASAGRVFCR